MAHNYSPKTSIIIPLKNSSEDEIIEINFDDLPEGEEVLQILKGERAALHYWLDLALEYYKAGLISDFIKILEQSGEHAALEYQDYEKDQMRALDMLAAYYVLQGNKERNKERKKEWFTKATLLYTTADKIIMYDQNHLLGRAYFCLLEGNKFEQADAQFNFVINQAANTDSVKSIPAMMGKACIAFTRKEFKNALFFYKKCLRLNHNCPADVRVGMGYCLARLNKYDKARLAFERAMELDPSNIAAIVALAVLDINTLEPENIRRGIQGLSMAYQMEQENPMALNHLANHFFYKNDLEKTEQLAWHAFQLTENDAMRAESCYHLARCFHKKGDYDHAFRYYYQATQFNHPKFILPYFGLGQIYIYREEYESAIAAFEKILKVAPNNYETLSVLGSLYTYMHQRDLKAGGSGGSKTLKDFADGGAEAGAQQLQRGEKARELLKRVVQICPDDIEVLIELAHLQEQNDPQGALQKYLRVGELLQDKIGVDIPAEILNNIGSLYFILGDLAKSKNYFDDARNSILADGVENLNDETTALLITVSYNLGRANEALCLFDEAEKLYRGIIKRRPNYVDCILRLGCLVRDKGDSHNASLLFKESLSSNPTNPGPWTLIGNLHMAKNEWGPAQKKFEHILKLPGHQSDAYSYIALGNIWLETLFSSRTKEKDGLYRDRALSYYVKVLKHRPKNIWAANGIGCLLASKGEHLESRDVFSQVREATADFPDVWINIAHVYMEQRQYVSALQMYKNCMSKFGRQNDVHLMMYIARAYWRANKLAECRDYVEKSIIETPENLLYKFNHAVVLQRMAKNVLKDEKSTLAMVTSAMEDLKIAEKTFTFISGTAADVIVRYKYISRTVCSEEARACSDLLKQARTYLHRAQTKDEEERRQRERQEEERLALMRKREEEERHRQEEKMRELEELKKLRQHYVEKTKEILRLPQVVSEKKARAGGGGGGRSRKHREDREEFVNDSSDLGEYDGEAAAGSGERRRVKDKKKRKRDQQLREDGSASSDEGSGSAPRRKKPATSRREVEELPARMRGKIKSKAFLSSSESSSDSEKGGTGGGSGGRKSDGNSDDEPPPQRSFAAIDSNDDDDDDDGEAGSGGGRKSSAGDSDKEEEDERGSPAAAKSDSDDADDGSSGRPAAMVASDDDSDGGGKAPRQKARIASDSDEDE